MTVFIAPAGKLNGHLDRVHQMRTIGRTLAPVNVEVDLSNRCSLGCEWCHFAYTHTRGPLKGAAKPAGAVAGGDLMDLDLAYRLIDDLAATGARSITWTGGGEPTLHPDFRKVVWYADGKIKQSLYTHGGHIDRNLAGLLKETMTFVYVSLDAADAGDYLRDKGVDRFKQACQGVRELVAAAGDATVGVGFLVTEKNMGRVGEAAWLADSLGADYIQFRPTVRYRQDLPGTPSEDTAWLDEALRNIQKASYYTANVEVDTDRFRMYQHWQGHGYDICWWSGLQTVVTPNGKVWSCVNKREHAAAEIGDLTVDRFDRIWDRHRPVKVGPDCRVMCRGHIANLALQPLMQTHPHPDFV